MLERVAGFDVHRDTVAVCVRVPGPGSTRQKVVKTFGTMTADLLALRDWLTSQGVTHVAMESTGVLWKPVYYLLEPAFTVILVNAAHMKNVPGRKTDVKDCEWIAELLEHGLLRASFVPPKPIRDLRDLTRHRTVLTQERSRGVQRLHKVLQDAGVKLSSVATDIMGVSGRAMIEALMQGTKDAEVLADLARGRLRAKLPELRKALEGRFRGHHAFLASQILAHIDYLEEAIAEVGRRIEEEMRPFASEVERLQTIAGVGRKTAEIIVAEIGVNMKQFPSARHLASWAGMCSGNNESAGKHKSGRTRKGNGWLRSALVEAALAAIRTRNSYFSAQYGRVMRRRGHKKAVVAVGHSILVIAYHLISRGKSYAELGAKYFEERNREAIERRCRQQLERLGFQVTLSKKEAIAS
jgi:transposase